MTEPWTQDPNTERRERALALARDLLAEHAGSKGYRAVIDERTKRRLGVCRYRRREIGISAWLVDGTAPWSEVEDTIRHEVAHAVVGPGYGHGPEWKAAARRVGANPSRCSDVDAAHLPKGKWRVRCPNGCTDITRHRRSRRGTTYVCTTCKDEVTWTRNELASR